MNQFILHLVAEETGETIQLAFLDARRLGRIRLRLQPSKEPPISELGFDPLLSMPTFEEFASLVSKRSCPIKALLLDQSFSAGVGNWVAGDVTWSPSCRRILLTFLHSDEILYNSRIHPEQRSNLLTLEQLTLLHHQTSEICRIAVSVNADDSRFPEHWLFQHRWARSSSHNRPAKR